MALYENKFNIGAGVQQGFFLSPLLFILVMEEVTRAFRQEGNVSCYVDMTWFWLRTQRRSDCKFHKMKSEDGEGSFKGKYRKKQG